MVIFFALPVLNYLKKSDLNRQGRDKSKIVKLENISLNQEKKKKKKIKLKELKKPIAKAKAKKISSRFNLKTRRG